jgi:beta-glucuronidase
MRTQALANRSVRRAAFDYLQSDIADNQDHPSIFMWSVGNELPSRPSPPVAAYIRQAAATGRHVDPTRPVGIDIVGYPDIPCQRAYNRLQIIGFGNYFGWYTGPAGQLADRDLTSEYMDSLRACYPNKAIIMSEFGAEANRDGPKDEKGTYAFQNDWITYQLGVMQSKSWLSGAFYWTLREFRVRPGWDGGNPKPDPPLHEKGVETFDGQRKPAFSILQQAFQQTQQYG